MHDFPEEREAAQRMKWEKVKDLAFLDDEQIAQRLHKMITYAVGRVDHYESVRHRYLAFGLGLFAGSIAFGTLLVRMQSNMPPVPLMLSVVGMVVVLVTGLALAVYYNDTTAKEYAYRSIADIRSWYFRYHFPTTRKLVLSEDETKARAQAQEMGKALEHFLSRWLEFASEKRRFVAEDLEQVFILFLLQRYKFQAVQGMSRILTAGIGIAVLLFISAAAAWLFS